MAFSSVFADYFVSGKIGDQWIESTSEDQVKVERSSITTPTPLTSTGA
jgi:hypothetical protein